MKNGVCYGLMRESIRNKSTQTKYVINDGSVRSCQRGETLTNFGIDDAKQRDVRGEHRAPAFEALGVDCYSLGTCIRREH
jgi:hypothetical protein